MSDSINRYARQLILPGLGEDGQLRLARSRVLIVGLGGLGAPVTLYLAGSGVGHLGLCDPDVVSLSNLQRQVLYTEGDVGRPKTECALNAVKTLNSEVDCAVVSQGLTSDNALELIESYDLVIDCTDNFATRYLIDDVCAATSTPWLHAAIGAMHGQLGWFQLGAHRRYSELYPDRAELIALPRSEAAVIGPLPGVIGSMQACEAIKYLAGMQHLPEGSLFTIDLTILQSQIIEF